MAASRDPPPPPGRTPVLQLLMRVARSLCLERSRRDASCATLHAADGDGDSSERGFSPRLPRNASCRAHHHVSAKSKGAANSGLRRSFGRAAAHICRTRDIALAATAYTSAHKPVQGAGRRGCQISSRLVARRCRHRCPASPESGMERPPRSIERWLPSSSAPEPSRVTFWDASSWPWRGARRVGERACMVWEPDGRWGLRRPRGRRCSDLGRVRGWP